MKLDNISADAFYDYLAIATSPIDYHARIQEFLTKMECSDFSVAQFDAQANVQQHFQTASQQMLEESYKPDDYNLISQYAIKNQGIPIHLSDLAFSIQKDENTMALFDGFVATYNVIKKYGFCDFYNLPVKIPGADDTLLLSIACHDVAPTEFKKRVDRYSVSLSFLSNAIAKSYQQATPEQQLKDILSPRQIDVIDALSKYDCSLSGVADKMNLALQTVKTHLANIRKATGTSSPTYLVARALRENLIS
ncbi:response regulator transcription factor [bacterium AH-315-K03]|nr:response regulator transcription factor [bacterium AH-315-K03]